jgi:hypothetical protein
LSPPQPNYQNSGDYQITFTATDNGNNTGTNATTNLVVPIRVVNANRLPEFAQINNITVTRNNPVAIPITVSDADGDSIQLTATGTAGYNLPSFITIENNILRFAANETTRRGNYVIKLIATEQRSIRLGETNSREYTFVVTVDAPDDLPPDNNVNNNNSAVNRAPKITPTVLQTATEGKEFVYQIAANDPDGDAIIFDTLAPLPKGASLNPQTGKLAWLPNYDRQGNYQIAIRATDTHGASDTTIIDVLVNNVNRAPELTVTDKAQRIGKEMSFTLLAKDADGEVLSYSAENLPIGASLNAVTGEFKWIPNPGQVGDYPVKFSVTDGTAVTSKTVVLKGVSTLEVPTVKIDLTPSFAVGIGRKVTISTLADSITNIANITTQLDRPNDVEVTQVKSASEINKKVEEYRFAKAGKYLLTARVVDIDGVSNETTQVIKVRDLDDRTAPIVGFNNLLDGQVINDLTNLVGVVNEANLDDWQLEISEFGRDEYTIIGRGESSGDRLSLVTLPNEFLTGFYTVRLTAKDLGGLTAVTTRNIGLVNSRVEETIDWNAYPSLAAALSSFKNGFSDDRDFDLLQVDRDIHTNTVSLQRGTRLYLTTPEGSRVGFTFQPEAVTITGLTYYRPRWQSDAGNNYVLRTADTLLTAAGDRFFNITTGTNYSFHSLNDSFFIDAELSLTSSTGVVSYYRQDGSLVGQLSTTGKRLVYNANSIVDMASGDRIEITRNSLGKVVGISSNTENLQYTYDSQNRLATMTDIPSGNITRYGYDDNKLAVTVGKNSAVTDLGSASQWSSKSVLAGDVLAFAVTADELASTATGKMLVGVRGGTITGATDLGGGIYLVAAAGTYRLDATSTGVMSLSVVGDVNRDGKVDGIDTNLINAGEGDINGDGVVNAVDLQLASANYGFLANVAPTWQKTPTGLVHLGLSTSIDLASAASDLNGDKITYRIADITRGTASLTADGKGVVFASDLTMAGEAGFTLVASDGIHQITTPVVVKVSDAPLVGLDFVKRNPRLQVGDTFDLQVVGDFADESNVQLPSGYVVYQTLNNTNETIRVSQEGLLNADRDGTATISASHEKVSTFTTIQVGEVSSPTNQRELNISLAGEYGLNLYPRAITLIPGVTRQLLVSINNIKESPDLHLATSGTQYLVSNPDVIRVSENGLITAIAPGQGTISVVNGFAEEKVPFLIELPRVNNSPIDDRGGAVQNLDGTLVTRSVES